MSPERVNGQDYGYASDVWALVTPRLQLLLPLCISRPVCSLTFAR